jgi:hypothetical protein
MHISIYALDDSLELISGEEKIYQSYDTSYSRNMADGAVNDIHTLEIDLIKQME